MGKLFKREIGITLIALIITIIVMLILAAVSITMAVNGGLFGYAQNASQETKTARDQEQELGTGIIGGKTIEELVNGVPQERTVTNPYKESNTTTWTVGWIWQGKVEFENGILTTQSGSWSGPIQPSNVRTALGIDEEDDIEEVLADRVSAAKAAGNDLVVARAYQETGALIIEGTGAMGALISLDSDCYAWQVPNFATYKALCTHIYVCDGVTAISARCIC